jgi:chorismate mutase
MAAAMAAGDARSHDKEGDGRGVQGYGEDRGTVSAERLVGIRGATTVDDDERSQLVARTRELLVELLDRNGIGHDDLVSILFTATDDLTSEFPAVAARELGLGDVPLICARELGIRHGNPRTVRVLLHCYSTTGRASLRHVYLHDARGLRDDLPE